MTLNSLVVSSDAYDEGSYGSISFQGGFIYLNAGSMDTSLTLKDASIKYCYASESGGFAYISS